MAYQIGDRVGDYEIVDVLGAGGMGKVYKVRNVISERVEAMKVLLPNLESDPDLADRFMREIKVQGSLQHPHIAALHTALRINNQLLMLIEFVEGRTLEAELRNGPIPVHKAVDYVCQVLSALGYAHSHGVVHRDIKPANMMLTPSGTVKLMDFGIARLAADRRLTQTGKTVGSLYYMSPEQIQGALDLDARSDLYSLGVSLYEMVTHRRPFQGDSDYSIMAAHLNASPVAPVEIDPSLPPMLSEVILMTIAKDPSKRFQTADALKKALENVAASLKQQPSAATRTVDAGRRPASAAVAQPFPVASGPVPPPMPPPAKSRRGLYMALGSVVTIAVLVVLALQAPKFFSSSSASSVPGTEDVATLPPQTAPTAEPAPAAAQPVDTPSAAEQPTAPQVQAQAPAQSATTTPGTKPAPAARYTSTAPVAARPASQVAPAAPVQYSSQPAAAAQVPVPSYAPPAQPVQTAAPAGPDDSQAEALRAHRQALMLLGSRANSIKASLNTLKQQQQRMGTNLRADISTAEQRMEFFLDEAETAIKSGDANGAKENLASAERAIETIEKFLGR